MLKVNASNDFTFVNPPFSYIILLFHAASGNVEPTLTNVNLPSDEGGQTPPKMW